MESGRVYNFSAGPSMMPDEVLQQAQAELLNYGGSGMSVMEMSHRSEEYMAIQATTAKDLREVFAIPASHKVLFMQGGGCGQFAAIPLNLLPEGGSADYIVTGKWSGDAVAEAKKYGNVNVVLNTRDSKFSTVPDDNGSLPFNKDAAYVYYCSNETIHGVEMATAPAGVPEGVPVVCDMTSNFLSRPVDWSKHQCVIAGASKNAGPAGMTMVIIDERLLGRERGICPSILSYKTAHDNASLYHTPPAFAIYMAGLYLQYTKSKGGIKYWDERSNAKAALIYDTIDASEGFYSSLVETKCRSRMNIPFQIRGGDDRLQKMFVDEAKKLGMITLAGHALVGACRASLYNGMPLEGVQKLAEFMKEFMAKNK